MSDLSEMTPARMALVKRMREHPSLLWFSVADIQDLLGQGTTHAAAKAEADALVGLGYLQPEPGYGRFYAAETRRRVR